MTKDQLIKKWRTILKNSGLSQAQADTAILAVLNGVNTALDPENEAMTYEEIVESAIGSVADGIDLAWRRKTEQLQSAMKG